MKRIDSRGAGAPDQAPRRGRWRRTGPAVGAALLAATAGGFAFAASAQAEPSYKLTLLNVPDEVKSVKINLFEMRGGIGTPAGSTCIPVHSGRNDTDYSVQLSDSTVSRSMMAPWYSDSGCGGGAAHNPAYLCKGSSLDVPTSVSTPTLEFDLQQNVRNDDCGS